MSIISNSCVAGFIYHDLKLQFKSPTINILFRTRDFPIFIENFDLLMKKGELIEINDERYSCPSGALVYNNLSITMHFLHSSSFKIAKEEWDRRKLRINFNNLYFVLTDFENKTFPWLNNIKDKNILILTDANVTNENAIIFNPLKEKKGYVDPSNLFNLTNSLFSKRFFWNFDFVKWFNRNCKN